MDTEYTEEEILEASELYPTLWIKKYGLGNQTREIES